MGGSYNGSTVLSKSTCEGSIPSPPANQHKEDFLKNFLVPRSGTGGQANLNFHFVQPKLARVSANPSQCVCGRGWGSIRIFPQRFSFDENLLTKQVFLHSERIKSNCARVRSNCFPFAQNCLSSPEGRFCFSAVLLSLRGTYLSR